MIADWRNEAIHECFTGMGIDISHLGARSNYTLQFDDGDTLHLDLTEDACLHISVRHPVIPNEQETVVDKLLRFNFYKKSSTLRPLGYMLEDALVLRLVLPQEQSQPTTINQALINLRKAREQIMDTRYA